MHGVELMWPGPCPEGPRDRATPHGGRNSVVRDEVVGLCVVNRRHVSSNTCSIREAGAGKEAGQPSISFSYLPLLTRLITSPPPAGPWQRPRWACAGLAAAAWRVNPVASAVYLAGSEMCKYIICKAGKERLGRICGSVGRTKKNVF